MGLWSPSPPMPARFVIYTRQSVDTLKDLSSCEAQFAVCKDFARANGERDEDWIGVRFDDQGWSGASLARPAMAKLRDAIRDGRVQRLYAVALDRLSRSMRDVVALLGELDAAGVELRLVHQPEVATGAEGRFLRHILGSFAQFEHELIAARLADTRQYLKKRGRRLAGPPPYGYDADRKTKQLVPNKKEARRPQAIFEMAATGELPTAIARQINRRGWRTKRRFSRRSGRVIGGGKWTARQVIDVLRNPVCTGGFADKGKVRPGGHAAIVDSEIFIDAQANLDARRTTASRRRTRHDFPLRGKVVCPGCGRAMSTYTVSRALGPQARAVYRYYRCRSTAGGRQPCPGRQYPAYELEKFVVEVLQDPTTWHNLTAEGSAPPDGTLVGHALAAAWTAIDIPSRHRLLPKIVGRVAFSRASSRVAITFTPGLLDVVSGHKSAT